MSSPTQRSLKHMRKLGYKADVAERWIQATRNRKDLFGFCDIVAIRPREVVFVQATSGSNVSSRVKKITDHENTPAVREAGIRILVQGWRKNAKGRYELREVDCS